MNDLNKSAGHEKCDNSQVKRNPSVIGRIFFFLSLVMAYKSLEC